MLAGIRLAFLRAIRRISTWTNAARAAQDNLDHLACLLQLCELELIDRERRAAERRLKAAKFPSHNTLDTFDFKARPRVNKPLLLELVQGEYLERRENLLLVDPSGTGKTHLALGLGIAACGQEKRVRLWRVGNRRVSMFQPPLFGLGSFDDDRPRRRAGAR